MSYLNVFIKEYKEQQLILIMFEVLQHILIYLYENINKLWNTIKKEKYFKRKQHKYKSLLYGLAITAFSVLSEMIYHLYRSCGHPSAP